MVNPKPYLGATTETWVKILFPMLVAAIVAGLAWSFKVEQRLGHRPDDSEVRHLIKEHAAAGTHRGAAQHADLDQVKVRLMHLERQAAKTDALLISIASALEDIKREIRALRNERRHR